MTGYFWDGKVITVAIDGKGGEIICCNRIERIVVEVKKHGEENNSMQASVIMRMGNELQSVISVKRCIHTINIIFLVFTFHGVYTNLRNEYKSTRLKYSLDQT